MSNRLTRTDRIELVETHNLVLAFNRLNEGEYDTLRWKRALYHALAMSGRSHGGELERIRIALQLP